MTVTAVHKIHRLVALALAMTALAACSSQIGLSGGGASAPASPAPTEEATPSATASGPLATSSPPTLAAKALLLTAIAGVEISVRRTKRAEDPIETLVLGSGQIEPALWRGRVRYDLGGLLATPAATSPAAPRSVVDIIWTRELMYVRFADDASPEWQVRTREQARVSGGLLGRLPDEALGLVELVAAGAEWEARPADGEDLAGGSAQCWLAPIPVDDAVRAGVPADTPDEAVLRRAYRISEIEVDVCLVDGAVRRIRYALAREKAPYGGPDRTIVTYDWQPGADLDPIVVPDVSAPPR